MPWRFVGRGEQLSRITTLLDSTPAGLVVITGDSGAGRSSLLYRVLNDQARVDDFVICLAPPGGGAHPPFGALRSTLGADFAAGFDFADSVSRAVRALVGRAHGRRIVVGVDDAHLVDHATMFVLRCLVRDGSGFVLLTRPSTTALPGPDPTDVVAYENGVTLGLPPLTVNDVAAVLTHAADRPVGLPTVEALHTATGGNPRMLHDLLVVDGLLQHLVEREGVLRLNEIRGQRRQGTYTPDLVIDGVRTAWRALAVHRIEELYRLALWLGVGEQAAVEYGYALLLRGKAREAVELLDSLPDDGDWRAVLLRALCVGFGLGRPDQASDFLLESCSRAGRKVDRLHAFRGWLLASSGRSREAEAALRNSVRSDATSMLFRYTALAVMACEAGRSGTAVSHFRRALALASGHHDDLPWVSPYLTACLIDALLMAGRFAEATGMARDFHGRNPDSGWAVAVALASLTPHRSGDSPRDEVKVA